MEGKLVKTGNDYILYSKDKTVLGITSGTMEGRMLSLKNCQAIENGYDLDELVKEQYPIDEPSFKRGFKLALEILGDKKFSVEDIQNVIDSNEDCLVWANVSEDGNDIKFYLDEDVLIESLQQTEWDVTFNPDEKDSEGCLILKRK